MNRLGLLGAAVVGGAVSAAFRERPTLRISRHEMPWPGLRRAVRVVHLTDLHIGWSTPAALLEQVTAETRSLGPDLVALTGDYVNVSLYHAGALERFVSGLPGPVVAVLGNHDHLAGAAAIAARLRRAGAVVLQNAGHEVAGLTVVGVDDGFSGHDDCGLAFSSVLAGAPILGLTHFPPTAPLLAERGARLVLAGHTHAGQFELPGRWTERLASLAGLGGYLRGFHGLGGGSQLYVNAGLGHARRGMRWGEACRPELAVFDLLPSGPR